MSDLIVSSYFREIAKFLPIDFEVEGVPFELMPLTDGLIEKIKDDHSSEKVIKLAADWSLSYDGIRVIDNDKLKKHIDELWKDERLPDAEPEIREQVGAKAIEISGLSDYIKELQDDEELARMEEDENIIDGDNLPDVSTTLGELNENKQAVHNAIR